MHRIATQGPGGPLHDLATTRRLEAAALAGVPPHTLMQRAGVAVARLALALAPHARFLRVWVGAGNNGGDGLEAAIELQRLGKRAEVMLAGLPATVDAKASLVRARDAGIPLDPPDARPLGAQDLVIDALLGLGASREPSGAIAQAIHQLNAQACPVLAVDLPSGLHADTGQPLGNACVRATHTLTLLTLKPGLFTGQGRDLAGDVWWDDLGCALAADGATALLYAGALPGSARRHAQHKGSFGDVAVVGGAAGMSGAALLAGRAAHAAGAGRVFVHMLDPSAPPLDAVRPELMLRQGVALGETPAVWSASTVVAGCGGGHAVAAALPGLLTHAGRLVLDADALNALATDTALQALLHSRAARGHPSVLTPHPLEAARLLGLEGASQVQADRLAAAHALAERLRCIVVLKGSGSIVASPGRPSVVNASGNASLASAGTGDVLAGWLAGHWTQRDEEDPFERAFRAACHATWQHGRAAERARKNVLRAADLVETLALEGPRPR